MTQTCRCCREEFEGDQTECLCLECAHAAGGFIRMDWPEVEWTDTGDGDLYPPHRAQLSIHASGPTMAQDASEPSPSR